MKKKYQDMTAKELGEATKQYDREFVGTPGKSLSAAQKARHRRAAKRGRPRIGKGAERINVTIERDLLHECDRLARKTRVSRAQIIALALTREINARKTA